jgi:hypothetical protein
VNLSGRRITLVLGLFESEPPNAPTKDTVKTASLAFEDSKLAPSGLRATASAEPW